MLKHKNKSDSWNWACNQYKTWSLIYGVMNYLPVSGRFTSRPGGSLLLVEPHGCL